MAARTVSRRQAPDMLERFFKLRENATTVSTEIIGGVTTFFVMAYIIALNPIILNYVGIPDLQSKNLGPGFAQTVAMTALCAGVLTIAMGLYANRPFAMAAGLGLNAVVAFQLVLGKPALPWQAAMGIIVLGGGAITILVLTGLREAILNAIPLVLKQAIGVGIGLFILLIGLVNSGIVIHPASGAPIITLSALNTGPILTFMVGLVITLTLFARGVRAALLLGIIGTTIVAGVLHAIFATYVPSTAPGTAQLPSSWLQAPDFSNSFSGLNFNAFSILGPLAAILVGFLMAGIASKIDFTDIELGLPALLTIVVMPFTYSITNGVGAGFVTFAFIKLVRGKASEVHWLMWVVVAAFILYFAQNIYAGAFGVGGYRE